jgi:hypothetical protein
MDGGRILHHAAVVTKLRALAACWGAAIILGAAWLHTFHPRNRGLARLLAAEATHVTAHVILYGALAAILWFASAGRRAIVIGGSLVVAVLQESAQSILYGRAPGRGEAFDLCVDAIAVGLALWICGRFPRRSVER